MQSQPPSLSSSALRAQLAWVRAAICTGLLAGLQACGGGNGSGTGAATFEEFAFELRTDVALANDGLIDAEMIDWNGDGRPDLVECDYSDHTLAIGRCNAKGQIEGLFYLITPGAPWALCHGDFDADQRIDFAITTHDDDGHSRNTLSLFLQNQQGKFLEAGSYDFASVPFDVSAGDLAGDGRDRLLVSLPSEARVLRFGLEAAGLVLEGGLDSSALQSGTPTGVVVLDFDGDGLEDVVASESSVAGLAPGRVVGWRNAGAGVLAAAQVLVPSASEALIYRNPDVDGDGLAELVVSQLDASAVLLLLPRAAGPSELRSVDLGSPCSSAVFADFDRDGALDVAATLWKLQALAVRMGLGPNSYAPRTVYNVGSAPRAIRALELPGDTHLDLFCANAGDASFLYGSGDGRFEAARGMPVGIGPAFVRCADLDLDGDLDLITIDRFQNRLTFLEGYDNANFELVQSVPLLPTVEEAPCYAVAADFTSDGLPDVLSTVCQGDRALLLRNLGGLQFSSGSLADTTAVGAAPLGLAVGDLDADGDLDAVVSNSGSRGLSVLIGDGAGAFEALPEQSTGGPRPLAALLAKLDADAYLDLALTAGETDGTANSLLLFSGDGAGGFVLRYETALGATSPQLACGDFDSDGRCDLVASQGGAGTSDVYVLCNRGNFVFESTQLRLGLAPGAIVVADVDHDGDQDLLAPVGQGQLRLALNDGKGNFPAILPPDGSRQELPVPFNTLACEWADADGDGLPDLFAVSPDTPFVWVARTRVLPAGPAN